YEIDGHTLAINVEGPADMKSQCRIFAQIASTSISGVTSVAVTDLNDQRGNVTLCNVEDYSRLAELAVRDNWPLDKAESNDAAPDPTGLPVGGSATAGLTGAALNDKIRQDASAQRLEVDGISTGTNTIVVYFENDKYFFETDAVGRLARVLLADAPPNVEIFRLISLYRGVPTRQTKILRSDLERILSYNGSAAELDSAVSLSPAPIDNPILDAQQQNYPRFGWSVFPRLARSFFDPKAPARFGIFGDADGYVDVWPGFTLEGLADLAIYNGLAGTAVSNSVLPHVRSDFGEYYKHGAYGLSSLTATWRARPTGEVFTEVKAGYLEDMFAGVGGQILWRPEGQRWAIGADAYQVWQRGFDRLLDLRSYNVVTGHVNIYYESPWYGLSFAVHGGRYLAGDWGGTIEISRRFDTGVEIGAFATFTNVPFSKFGEGSFDKGIIIRIPLEWMLPIYTQSEAKMDFRPLSRDGGQRLDNDDSLYDETRRTSYGEMYGHFSDIASP
ncbi:MAG TPA: YjbH domain-containing protein, partial [Rhizomicrobium sp.]